MQSSSSPRRNFAFPSKFTYPNQTQANVMLPQNSIKNDFDFFTSIPSPLQNNTDSSLDNDFPNKQYPERLLLSSGGQVAGSKK